MSDRESVTSRTCAAALDRASAVLAAAGVVNARREARMLLGHATAFPTERLLLEPERPIDRREWARFVALIERRTRREPLAYILGEREFWSLPFRVTSATLSPRPDSETLVEAALDAISDRSGGYRVLDLGTGSGCLLLALLSELPRAFGVGVDASLAAIEVARANARRLGFEPRARFVVGDWGRALHARFDVILCNPPYVAEPEIATLQPEISRHEPRLALAAGSDGLACYRLLAPAMARLLGVGGVACVEVGAGLAEAVADLSARAGLKVLARRRDLAGIERCLVLSAGPRAGKMEEQEKAWKRVA